VNGKGYQPEPPTGLPQTPPPPPPPPRSAPPRGGSGMSDCVKRPERPETLGSDSLMFRYIGDALVYIGDCLRFRA
jgi:hypothetical protein